ncbi:MAG: hypothetical protein JRH20_21100, partial [Deltaproteobacteria bacterium]|nr:hypothetical protein [Deltaproteobacteria bacterium]
MRWVAFSLALQVVWIHTAEAQDLILQNETRTLGGVHRYKTIRLTNATIVVPAFDGADKLNTGNLQLVADT